ncbi:hypothetical protein GCM10027275_56240 [Rhabdobacter roseus]|uniref:DUF306 domain-containing protein n=1 Tax=Rhabdobacter roseus TaxID=1655419 RepID=A0A840U214_9BACT|nr:hypothetical protein [Rhabdobacter roseus]MBB5287633.1 hypothetical protein [Rhabdobacter roseus]
MKSTKYLVLALLALLLGCRREQEVSPEALKPLVGRWQLVAYEQNQGGVRTWVEVPAAEALILQVRFDGVLLDGQGLAWCCAPPAIQLNGTLIDIIPRAEVPRNLICDLADCMGCATLDLDLDADTLLLTSCNGGQMRYARVR